MKYKLYAIILLVLITALPLSARGADDAMDTETVRLIVPSGATLATVALLHSDSIADGFDVDLEVIKSSDILAARLISGEADFAVIPTNLAAVLYNKGTGIRMAGPSIWGLNYIVTSEDIDGIEGLKGRSVNMIGRGLTPDITFPATCWRQTAWCRMLMWRLPMPLRRRNWRRRSSPAEARYP